MGLLRRSVRVTDRPFWQVAPFATSDPGALYHEGIACVTAGDGRGMIAVGWALWDLVGLHQHQARDFLFDGYTSWSDAAAPVNERVAFLTAVLDRLRDIQPAVPPGADFFALPAALVTPAAHYYGLRSFAVRERLGLASAEPLTPAEMDDLLVMLDSTHAQFLSARVASVLASLRASRGIPPS